MLNESPICIIMFLLSSFCFLIPGMKLSRWACSIYCTVGKMLRDMTGKWQIAIHRSGSTTAEIWMCSEWGSRVTQVSARSLCCRDEAHISTWISFHSDSRKCWHPQSWLHTAAVPLIIAPCNLLRIIYSSWGSYIMLLPADRHRKLLHMQACLFVEQ